MPDIRFRCPHCEGKLIVDEAGIGLVIRCPECNQILTIPPKRDTDAEAGPSPMPEPGAVPADGVSGDTCTRCGKQVVIEKGQIVEKCHEAEIELVWDMGPTLKVSNTAAAGLNQIIELLTHTSSTKADAFRTIVGSWAPSGRCATCGEQWCHECIKGNLPALQLTEPPHCRCG